MTERQRSRRCRGDGGAAILETAVVTLPFFILIFGILDFGILFKSYLGTGAAANSGARVASTQANSLSADYHILTAVDRAAAALDRDDIERVIIFKADSPGDGPDAGCLSGGGGVADECNVYFPAAFELAEDEFDCDDPTGVATDTNWCPTDRVAYFADSSGAPTTPDLIGVQIVYNHEMLTGMFGSEVDFSSTSVLRIEPQGANAPT
jgi:hypothetical protein